MPRLHSFSKWERIRKSWEYEQVIKGGNRVATPHFVIFILKKEDSVRRIGISVGKRVGKGAVRNRVKRLLREAFRLNKTKLEEGLDIVVIVRSADGLKKLRDAESELLTGLAAWVKE